MFYVGRSARAATSARRQNRCTLALENLIEGRLTSLRFFRASYETDGFEFSATSKALKKLVASLDGSILAHLIPLTAGWTGYMDGRKEWYWVPDEGYIKYLQTAVAYLIRRFQYDNAGPVHHPSHNTGLEATLCTMEELCVVTHCSADSGIALRTQMFWRFLFARTHSHVC